MKKISDLTAQIMTPLEYKCIKNPGKAHVVKATIFEQAQI